MVKVVKLHVCQNHHRESFVDLPQVHISRGHTNLGHKFVQCKLWSNREVNGVSGSVSIAHNLSQGAATHFSCLVCCHQNRGSRTIRRCRGISSGDSSSFPLKNCGQFCKLVKVHFLELLIFSHHHRGLASLPLHFHLNYLRANIAFSISLVCSPVALHPILILLLPGDAQLFGRVLTAVAHVELVVHIRQAVAGKAVSEVDPTIGGVTSVHVVGHIAHALKTTSHHHTVLAQLQRLAGLHDAFHSTGTHLVNKCARHRLGNSCSKHCLPIWCLTHPSL